MTLALWVLVTYLVGAIPASYLAGRMGAGVDLRRHGSGNLGATNLYRLLGWTYAIPVGIFDIAKGAVPVYVAARQSGMEPWMPLAVGVAAVVGHVFPVYLRFRGGKGVATAAGVVLALAPAALAARAVVWVTVLALTRFVSLASILGAAAFPAAVALFAPDDPYMLGTGLVLATFILYTHRSNVRRLLTGTENRFGRPRTVRQADRR